MKINLLAPAKGPDLRATARVVRAGRRIVVVEAEVVSVEGETEKRIAAVLGTMIPA
jgi:acyl-coenzyme A thioesterase PaaI-like protein